MKAIDDLEFMRMAIAEARRSKAEDSQARPKVGAIVVRDGRVIARGFRGELDRGDHAEYTVLERKAADETLMGATVYTTLEPCTTRNHPKVPCAERLIERKVARVVIGMLDPNPMISGRGQRRLRDANIATDLFPPDLMAEVEEMNRDFARAFKAEQSAPAGKVSASRNERADRSANVLVSIDDRIRIVSRTQFEPKWDNFQETYWLIGPISIENFRDTAVSLDGYLEASHSTGMLRFDTDATAFEYWNQAMRATHQAAAAQLFFPAAVAAHHLLRGICLVRFAKSELGGLGKYHEAGQKLQFVLRLAGSELYWSFALRMPYEWNPRPSPALKIP